MFAVSGICPYLTPFLYVMQVGVSVVWVEDGWSTPVEVWNPKVKFNSFHTFIRSYVARLLSHSACLFSENGMMFGGGH